MNRKEKIAILKDIINGEIVHPQVRKDVGMWAIKELEQKPINIKLMLMEANINGYTQGLKDSLKAESEK